MIDGINIYFGKKNYYLFSKLKHKKNTKTSKTNLFYLNKRFNFIVDKPIICGTRPRNNSIPVLEKFWHTSTKDRNISEGTAMVMEGGGGSLSELYSSSKRLSLKIRDALERLERLEFTSTSSSSLSSSNAVVAGSSDDQATLIRRDINQIQSLCTDMDRLWRSIASKPQRDLWKRSLSLFLCLWVGFIECTWGDCNMQSRWSLLIYLNSGLNLMNSRNFVVSMVLYSQYLYGTLRRSFMRCWSAILQVELIFSSLVWLYWRI